MLAYPAASCGKWLAGGFKPGGFVMKCNVGKNDRIVRVIIGLAIIWAGFYYEEWWGVIGVVFLVTAAIGYCPAYTPFKFSTCRKDD
jgi:hypothetical protein